MTAIEGVRPQTGKVGSAELEATFLRSKPFDGLFSHMEADWRDVLRTANEISIAYGLGMRVRAADLLRVAYAKELSAQLFVSYDGEQLALAKASGMETARPS